MKAVVGLGNPGPGYAATRHNVGFRVAETFALRHGARRFDERPRMQLARVRLDDGRGDEVLVVKPLTFMNRSGAAVRELVDSHGVAGDDLVVAHDDLDLELGDVRVKRGGGHGGHNGLRSILEETGAIELVRVRLGIRRPDPAIDAAAWVLDPFPADQAEAAAGMIERGADAVEAVLRDGPGRAMNAFNRRARTGPGAEPPGAAEAPPES